MQKKCFFFVPISEFSYFFFYFQLFEKNRYLKNKLGLKQLKIKRSFFSKFWLFSFFGIFSVFKINLLAYKSLATSNPSYIESRFLRVGNHTTLRRSEIHPAQALYCNFSRPEKANCSFKKAATDLLNGLNVSTFDMGELSRFKTRLYQALLERDKIDWQTRIIREGIEIWDLASHQMKKKDFIYLFVLFYIFKFIFNLFFNLFIDTYS